MIWACNIPLFLIIALKELLQVSFVFFSVGFSHHVGFLINLLCIMVGCVSFKQGCIIEMGWRTFRVTEEFWCMVVWKCRAVCSDEGYGIRGSDRPSH